MEGPRGPPPAEIGLKCTINSCWPSPFFLHYTDEKVDCARGRLKDSLLQLWLYKTVYEPESYRHVITMHCSTLGTLMSTEYKCLLGRSNINVKNSPQWAPEGFANIVLVFIYCLGLSGHSFNLQLKYLLALADFQNTRRIEHNIYSEIISQILIFVFIFVDICLFFLYVRENAIMCDACSNIWFFF